MEYMKISKRAFESEVKKIYPTARPVIEAKLEKSEPTNTLFFVISYKRRKYHKAIKVAEWSNGEGFLYNKKEVKL